MHVIAHIDISTPEGRQIAEWLRQFPYEVSFDDDTVLNEPQAVYETQPKQRPASQKYITLEEFRVEAKKYFSSEEFWKKVEEKRKRFCEENDIV